MERISTPLWTHEFTYLIGVTTLLLSEKKLDLTFKLATKIYTFNSVSLEQPTSWMPNSILAKNLTKFWGENYPLKTLSTIFFLFKESMLKFCLFLAFYWNIEKLIIWIYCSRDPIILWINLKKNLNMNGYVVELFIKFLTNQFRLLLKFFLIFKREKIIHIY